MWWNTAALGSASPKVCFFMEVQHMSRTVTPPQAQPIPQPGTPILKIPHEKIAMRAYEKWVKRGRQLGSPEQDWLEAEAELRDEFNRNNYRRVAWPNATRR